MNFDVKAMGNKSTRDRNFMEILKSPVVLVSATGNSKTIFLPSDPNELCNRLRLLLQEKKAGNNSKIINDENVAIVDKLVIYKWISKKQHKQILIEYNLSHAQKK